MRPELNFVEWLETAELVDPYQLSDEKLDWLRADYDRWVADDAPAIPEVIQLYIFSLS